MSTVGVKRGVRSPSLSISDLDSWPHCVPFFVLGCQSEKRISFGVARKTHELEARLAERRSAWVASRRTRLQHHNTPSFCRLNYHHKSPFDLKPIMKRRLYRKEQISSGIVTPSAISEQDLLSMIGEILLAHHTAVLVSPTNSNLF